MDDEFEPLAIEINDICKKDKIDFKWHYDEITDAYILYFRKDGKGLSRSVSGKELYLCPDGVLKLDIKMSIEEYFKKPDSKKELFEKLISEVQTLCTRDYMLFKHEEYEDTKNAYLFRFRRYGEATEYYLSEYDLLNKSTGEICDDVFCKIYELHDKVRNKIVKRVGE